MFWYGTSFAPAIVKFIFSHHEEIRQNECQPEFKSQFHRQYMDDCFVIFKCKALLPTFLEYKHDKHASLKFTEQSELRIGSLSWFASLRDFLISLLNWFIVNSLLLDWVWVFFFRFRPRNIGLNSILTLVQAAYNNSSDKFALHREFDPST